MKRRKPIAPGGSRYIHGTTTTEQARLSLLNDILNRAYIDAVEPRPGDRILDLGSGLGQFTALMASRASGRGRGGRQRGKARVVAIERDARQIATARKLLGASPCRRIIEFRRRDVTTLRLAESEWGSFDLAHTRYLLEHLPDALPIIKLMSKAVRPGGRVFISDDDHELFRLTPEPRGFRPLWKAYVRSYEALGNDPYVGSKLVWLMHEAGLVRVRIGGIFFGGCRGDEHFEAIADNLIGILEGAGKVIVSRRLMGRQAYERAMDALRRWKHHPDAAQWYMLLWAEGMRRKRR